MMYDWGYSSGYGVWGFIFMLFVMALGVAGVVIIVRYFSQNATNGHGEDTALEALKKRYAKGEIDKKEFTEIRKDLSA